MGSGGSTYSYPIEELVEKYRQEFKQSGYAITHYDVQVNDFVAWLCEQLEEHRKMPEKTEKFPMQPIIKDEDGTVRFKANPIVNFIFRAGPFSMDQIIELPGITREDMEQFAQLIGYSVSGFGELSYVNPESVKYADAVAEELLAK